MLKKDFYPTLQTYADGEIERTDNIDNLYSNDIVGSPYYLGYIEHDDFPKSFGVSLIDDSVGMSFKRIESNHSWGYCFNKNVFNASGTTPPLAIIQNSEGHTGTGGDRYCFLNKIKMAQQNSLNTVSFTMRFMYIPTTDIDDSGTTYFNQGYTFTYDNLTRTIEQLKEMIDGTADVYGSWTRNNITYPAIKYSDFNEYGLALVQSNDGTMTVAICISMVNIGDTGRYSYGTNNNVQCAVFPIFEHDYDDVHILVSQGTGFTENPIISFYQNSSVIRPDTNFGMSYDNQRYIFSPYPYDILVADLPTYNMYNRSGLIKGQYFLQYYGIQPDHVSMIAYAHYDLKDVYTMMLYYHKIYTDTPVFSKSYTTDISVATFNEHDGATGDRLSDDYVNIDDKLRNWQKPDTDISVNDYDPIDKPEYDPTPPSPINPPDEGDWGSKIPYTIFQMGNNPFSNFEQLTYGGLEEFMATLWHAPQTFWESLSATKELSANLNDYLISCRAYPIFINGALAHNDIYLGVGGKITLANTIYTPNIVNICACGSITVSRPYGNFLDYNPYTSASIYLPFAGQFEINPKYIYDSELSLILWVDLTDGSGVWVLRNTTHTYPILIKQCKVGIDIPISGQDAAQKSSNIINATLNTAQHALTSVNRITGIATQVGSAIASGGISGGSGINIGTEAAGMALAGLSDSVNMAMANKELPYYTTGSAGAAAAEACSEPYITLRAPLWENPTNFAHTVGNLYNKAAVISSLSGFTTCRNVDVGGISQATDKEKAQIKQILESGFYA